MTYKILVAAAALSLGLGTAAMAQTTEPAEGSGPATTLPENAFAPFFTEPFTGALYSQEQIGERWMNMSEEQQAQVRAECDTFATAGLPDDEVITSSIEDSTVYEASVSQLCDMVGAM